MDFYESFENDLSIDLISVDDKTSDMIMNNNENTQYLLSTLNEFFFEKNISKEIASIFNFEINQRIVWENIIEYDDPFHRKTFNMDDFLDKYIYEVPDYYFDLAKNDSIVNASIKYLLGYLHKKYDNFDFDLMNNILQREQYFSSFNYIFKIWYIFETLLPIAIKNNYNEYILLLEDENYQNKIQTIRSNRYIGLIWNTTMSKYLSKCDKDIFDIYENQSWDFVSSYTLKNI